MPKKVFDKQLIVDEAVKMARKVGLEKLSMRKLAAQLNCSVTPIYDAFESKDDLIEAVFRQVVGEQITTNDYFGRNNQILIYGIKYPILYRDIRYHGNKFPKYMKYYYDVMDLMKQENRLKGFNLEELESLNFDILIYINGLVERSIAETRKSRDIEEEYKIILEQVTELFVLGYKAGRQADNC